jgi:hypothetical protein
MNPLMGNTAVGMVDMGKTMRVMLRLDKEVSVRPGVSFIRPGEDGIQAFRHRCLFPYCCWCFIDPMSGPGAVESSAPYYNQSPKKKRNKWLWIGLPVLLAVIILGAVLGGVLGSRGSGNDNNSSNGSSGSNNAAADPSGTNRSGGSGSAGVGSTATGANGQAYLAISTDSNSLPVYPTAVSRKRWTRLHLGFQGD